MAHHLRYTITATAITVARFLHLFKFGLVVYGTSNVPRVGGSRETPAYFFFEELYTLIFSLRHSTSRTLVSDDWNLYNKM